MRNRKRFNIESVKDLLVSPHTREEALQLLEDSPFRGKAALAAHYLDDPDPFVRNQALACLLTSRSRKYEQRVSRLLKDADEIVRVTALECLVHSRTRSEWRAIAKLLNDEKPLVRAYASWALGRLSIEGALPRLKRAFRGEEDGAAQAGMAEALFRLSRDMLYLEALIKLLNHPDYQVRCFTANSLIGIARGKKTRERIQFELQAALRREGTVGGRECLEKNLAMIKP